MHCPVCHADDTKVVDSRLAEIENLLTRTLRTVSRGRQHLRTPLGVPFDYEEWQSDGSSASN